MCWGLDYSISIDRFLSNMPLLNQFAKGYSTRIWLSLMASSEPASEINMPTSRQLGNVCRPHSTEHLVVCKNNVRNHNRSHRIAAVCVCSSLCVSGIFRQGPNSTRAERGGTSVDRGFRADGIAGLVEKGESDRERPTWTSRERFKMLPASMMKNTTLGQSAKRVQS